MSVYCLKNGITKARSASTSHSGFGLEFENAFTTLRIQEDGVVYNPIHEGKYSFEKVTYLV